MPDFEFDATASLETNLEAFLAEMDTVDAEMAVILRANIDTLADVVRNGERNSRSRADFNTEVMQALDALLLQRAAENDD